MTCRLRAALALAGSLMLAGGLVVAGCSRSPQPAAGVTPVAAPGAPGSAEPNLVRGADGVVYLSWLEPVGNGAHALRFSRWTGEGWSEPATVAEGADWFVNWADVPAMAALSDGTLAASWQVMSPGDTYAYGVRLAVSRDGGKTWSEPVTPHRDATATEHGFVSLFPLAADRFGVVWLDGRAMADTAGAMGLRYTTLSRDGALGDEVLLDPRVCDCCATGAAPLAGGGALVVYRDRSPEEVRDIAVTRLDGGAWSEPVPVHADGWRIAGCPVNGPALAVRGSEAAVAWYTVQHENPTVELAFSADAGHTFSEPVSVGEAEPLGRTDVVLTGDGAALVSWVETVSPDTAEVRIRRVAPGGAPGEARTVAVVDPSRASGFPRIARWKDLVLAVWTATGDGGGIRTAVIR